MSDILEKRARKRAAGASTNVSDDTGGRVRDIAGAVERLGARAANPGVVREKLQKLFDFAQKHGQEKTLLDALSSADIAIFSSLSVIRRTLILADSAGRGEEFLDKFEAFETRGVHPPLWGTGDQRKALRKEVSDRQADASLVETLVSLKYVQSPPAFEDLRAAMKYYGPRLDLPEALIDTLYDSSNDKSSDKEDFVTRLKEGFVLEHLLSDLRNRRGGRETELPEIKSIANDLWSENAFKHPVMMERDASKPAVFLTFHGSLLGQIKLWYKTVFPDGPRVGGGAPGAKNIISSKGNANGALLDAYRSLLQGKPLLIAADSPTGTAKNLLSVLGREIPVADGFVFLAYESKADVYWSIVVENEGKLTPHLVVGPSRIKGETMAIYRERLLAFVGDQIAAYLTGDPQKICLGSKWIGLLSDNSGAYKERYYRPE